MYCKISCVLWTGEPGEFIVGTEAYEKRYYPNCIYSVKRLMQTPDAIVTLEKDVILTSIAYGCLL